MASPRLCVSSLLLLLLFALLSIALVIQSATGMGLRHLPTEPETAVDEENLSTPRRLEAQEYMTAMLSPLPLFCYTENDFDYVDNDIGNAHAASYTECCWLCYSATGCKAWSWSNYNGGTCWFKSKRGEVVYKPGVKSAIVFATPQNTCELKPDTDYRDNDIGRADSATAGGCCELCKNYPRCRAFSWNTYRGGSCWFKSAKGSTIYNPGVQSAEVYPNDEPIVNPPTCDLVNLEYNVDYYDNDIGNVPSASVHGCCSICKSWSGSGTCRAFSWSNHSGGTCWLKSLKGTPIANPGVISAVVLPNPPGCTIEDGVDYYDNDIGNTWSPTAEGCCSICKTWSGGGCKAFSWSNYNGGTCWLKRAKGSTISNPTVKSAIVT